MQAAMFTLNSLQTDALLGSTVNNSSSHDFFEGEAEQHVLVAAGDQLRVGGELTDQFSLALDHGSYGFLTTPVKLFEGLERQK